MIIYDVDAISVYEGNKWMIRTGDCKRLAGVIYLSMTETEIDIINTHTIYVRFTHIESDLQ